MLLNTCARVTCVLAVLTWYTSGAFGDLETDAENADTAAGAAISQEQNDGTSAQQEYDDDSDTYDMLLNSYVNWYVPTYGGNTDIENAVDGAQAALATAQSCLNSWTSDDSAAQGNLALGIMRFGNTDYGGALTTFTDAKNDANNADTDAQGAACACISAESALNAAANLLNNPPM